MPGLSPSRSLIQGRAGRRSGLGQLAKLAMELQERGDFARDLRVVPSEGSQQSGAFVLGLVQAGEEQRLAPFVARAVDRTPPGSETGSSACTRF